MPKVNWNQLCIRILISPSIESRSALKSTSTTASHQVMISWEMFGVPHSPWFHRGSKLLITNSLLGEGVSIHRPARCPNHFFAVNEPSAVPWWWCDLFWCHEVACGVRWSNVLGCEVTWGVTGQIYAARSLRSRRVALTELRNWIRFHSPDLRKRRAKNVQTCVTQAEFVALLSTTDQTHNNGKLYGIGSWPNRPVYIPTSLTRSIKSRSSYIARAGKPCTSIESEPLQDGGLYRPWTCIKKTSFRDLNPPDFIEEMAT